MSRVPTLEMDEVRRRTVQTHFRRLLEKRKETSPTEMSMMALSMYYPMAASASSEHSWPTLNNMLAPLTDESGWTHISTLTPATAFSIGESGTGGPTLLLSKDILPHGGTFSLGKTADWECCIDSIANTIRDTYSSELSLNPIAGVKRIGKIWNRVVALSELAEARTNLLLRKVAPPTMAAEPKWLSQQVAKLKASAAEENVECSNDALESASRLIRTCLATTRAKIEAELCVGPLGWIQVAWPAGPNRYQWFVEPTRLPWPGAKVHSYFRTGSGETMKKQTKVLFNAFDVLDNFKEHMKT